MSALEIHLQQAMQQVPPGEEEGPSWERGALGMGSWPGKAEDKAEQPFFLQPSRPGIAWLY